MKAIGKIIAKYKLLVIVLSVALLVPSAIGYIRTKVNYDILSYLPNSLETVYGQDIMVRDFGKGAFSMVIVEGMGKRDAARLEETMESVDHVEEVLWYDDIMGLDVPEQMLPERIRKIFFQGDATLMIALFDNTTSAESTMQAIQDLRAVVSKQCFISGMAGIVTDIKSLAMSEMPMYVVIASILSLIVLMLTTTSFVVPLIFLSSIGVAIVYNMGTNVFLGQISYITQALVAVLQLGVTMDYSIFLLHSYETARLTIRDREEAMGEAISETFTSVIGSSTTTIAGFAALIFMTFALGRDLGVVMIKGVLIGVICCTTFLPAMVLSFEKVIEKTRHRSFIPNMDRTSGFIIKHPDIWIALFLIIIVPAYRGNNAVQLYYNIDRGLPDTLESAVANKKLSEEFNMSNMHVLMVDSRLPGKDKLRILDEVEKLDGVQWALGIPSVTSSMVPEDMLPGDLVSNLRTDNYELMMVCSDYSAATPEVNAQIAKIDGIVKRYDPKGMVIGEAPLMKDLEDVTSVDLVRVNTVSVLAIFIIVMLVFKSVSLPAILVTVIEFAIFINMAWSYYTGVRQPFVAPVVVGTIQLGATVDYAILMTTHYVRERKEGLAKREAALAAHKSSVVSIITSGLSLFAATVGVALYSRVDMIKAIVVLLARGSLISMVVVIVLLPAMLLTFDKLICYTTLGMRACAKVAGGSSASGK
ncbi:MAG: MMPL family transporter [Clostridia bacterium]|nr:MMPL family transporter [Clostridia bacterium]